MIFNEILEKGFEGQHFINGLSSHFRDLMVSRDAVTVQLLEVSGDIRERYKAQAAMCPPEFLLEALSLSNECDFQYKISQNKRLSVELTLARIAQLTLKKK
jgi:DNA polymerase-3 subunit gamma/tau